MKLVALQPVYLPWLGYFDQMHRCDLFVYFDDGQFDRRGWRNRNRIKGPSGTPMWMTVPIRHNGIQRIMDVVIDNGQAWARKQLGMVRTYYAKAPYLHRYLPEFEELLHRRWELVVDLDLAAIDLMRGWLGVHTPTLRNSDIGVTGRRSELALNFCKHFGASHYLTGNAAKAYLEVPLLERNDISVEWHDYSHPVYRQQHGPFVSHMSALDLVFNCGDESHSILERRRELHDQTVFEARTSACDIAAVHGMKLDGGIT